MPSGGALAELGFVAAVVAVCTMVHEIGHAIAARAAGIRGIQVRLVWMGIIPLIQLRLPGFHALPESSRLTIIVAGSAAQWLLAAAAFVVSMVIDAEVVGRELRRLAAISLALGLINQFPVAPLDGSWVRAIVRGDVPGAGDAQGRWARPLRLALYVACGLGVAGMLARVLGLHGN